jgi:hypothetical protein
MSGPRTRRQSHPSRTQGQKAGPGLRPPRKTSVISRCSFGKAGSMSNSGLVSYKVVHNCTPCCLCSNPI